MTEKQANERLINQHDLYFNSNNDDYRYTRYAAVIKGSNNFYLEDDYKIEIAYSTGETWEDDKKLDELNPQSRKDLINRLNLPKKILEEYENNETHIVLTPEIHYQNDKNFHENCTFKCSDKCQGFCEEIYSESKKKYSKLTGGISVYDMIYDNAFGTAGAFFKTIKDNSIYLLSNYHVLLGRKGKIDDPISHPSKSDASSYGTKADEIGRIFWKKDIEKNSFNLIDVAIAKINTGVSVDIGKYTRCRHIQYKDLGTAKVGQNVRKCGKTTGLTYGEIRSINCTVNISREKKELDIYRKQILTTKMTEDGDSGSVLVNDEGTVIGLLFGGNNIDLSVANHIPLIIEAIKKDIPDFNIYKFV